MNKDKTPFNDKDQRHGLWEVYWASGDLMFKCFYHNGDLAGYLAGYEETYRSNGKIYKKRYNI